MNTRRVGTWIERAVWVVLACLAAWAFTTWVDLRPRPLVLSGIVVGAYAVGWILTDLAGTIDRIDWSAPRRRMAARHGLDPRFLQMARLLREDDSDLVSRRVHRDLIRVVDDRLMAHHGVDRDQDPELARQVLGPELAAYVEGPPNPRQLHPRQLNTLLSRIEAL